jgi:hypothetical protein
MNAGEQGWRSKRAFESLAGLPYTRPGCDPNLGSMFRRSVHGRSRRRIQGIKAAGWPRGIVMASFGLISAEALVLKLSCAEWLEMMTKCLAFAAVLLLLTPAVSAAKYKKRAKAAPPQQIACTVLGCVPVPRGCGQTPGRTWSGMPTGGDVIVCPPGVAPFR